MQSRLVHCAGSVGFPEADAYYYANSHSLNNMYSTSIEDLKTILVRASLFGLRRIIRFGTLARWFVCLCISVLAQVMQDCAKASPGRLLEAQILRNDAHAPSTP
jgi:hypothetical protein